MSKDSSISKEYCALLFVLNKMVDLYNTLIDNNYKLPGSSFGYFLYLVLTELEVEYGIRFDDDGPVRDEPHDSGTVLEKHDRKEQIIPNLHRDSYRIDVASHRPDNAK